MTRWKNRIAMAGSVVGLALLLTGPVQARDTTDCVAATGCVADTPAHAPKMTAAEGTLDSQARSLALLLAGAAALVFVGVRRSAKSY